MAHYLVKAKPPADLAGLRARLDSGGIGQMQPFGSELQRCLLNARLDADGWAVWEENCYCSPPLKQERAAVLDHYFSDLSTEALQAGQGWARIGHLPPLWD
ncbi:MAG: hypothetical protein K8J31_10330 [Anaerolineae bacterium]|nr:hypothetical protein [Anaerolineae bacterium]